MKKGGKEGLVVVGGYRQAARGPPEKILEHFIKQLICKSFENNIMIMKPAWVYQKQASLDYPYDLIFLLHTEYTLISAKHLIF